MEQWTEEVRAAEAGPCRASGAMAGSWDFVLNALRAFKAGEWCLVLSASPSGSGGGWAVGARTDAGGPDRSEGSVPHSPRAQYLPQSPTAGWLGQTLDQNPDHLVPFWWYFHDSALSHKSFLRPFLPGLVLCPPPQETHISDPVEAESPAGLVRRTPFLKDALDTLFLLKYS